MGKKRFQSLLKSYSRFSRNGSGQVPRAVRIPLQIPLLFRHLEETDWFLGITLNISQSGVWYCSSRVIAVETPIKMKYTLPVKLAGKQGMEVICEGQIVRAVTPSTVGGQAYLAAKIVDYLPALQ